MDPGPQRVVEEEVESRTPAGSDIGGKGDPAQ